MFGLYVKGLKYSRSVNGIPLVEILQIRQSDDERLQSNLKRIFMHAIADDIALKEAL